MPLQPTLLIGVGGSGGKSLRTLRQTLLRRLRAAGWKSNELPQAWQMLAIDTVTVNAADNYPEELLPGRDYLGLVPKNIAYGAIRESLVRKVPAGKQQSAYAGWLPRDVAIPIARGAGQFRAVGRAVSAYSLSQLRERISDAYKTCRSPQALAELAQVQDLLGGADDRQTDVVMPFVIASLAGGTGSGMFLDVVEALAAVDPQLGEGSQVILFGPDVFGPLLNGPAGVGIPANTLAAVGSVTAGVWGHEASDGSRALYAAHGLDGAKQGGGVLTVGTGSRNNYVIGAVNSSGSVVGYMNDAYRALGESLAAIMGDPNVTHLWQEYLTVNIFPATWNAAVCGDTSGLHVADPRYTQPFASFGSAKVSIGTERFHEYAAHAISRNTIEKLLWPTLEPLDPQDDRTDDAKIKEAAQQIWPSFLDRSGLDEKDARDDVVNALAAPDLEGQAQSASASIITKAGSGGKALDPQTWSRNIQAVLDGGLNEFLESTTSDRRELARKWVEQIRSSLPPLISEVAANSGIAVASALVDELRQEVRFVASSQLPVEAAEQERTLNDLYGRVSSTLSETGLSSIPINHPSMNQVRALLSRGLQFQEGARRYRTASELMLDLEENFLAPLAQALTHARTDLLNRTNADQLDDGRPNPFTGFPRIGAPAGKSYRPGPTEMLLLDPDKFPAILESISRSSLEPERRDQWRNELLKAAVSGRSFSGTVVADPFIAPVAGWVTRVPEAQGVNDSLPSQARFKVISDPEEVVKRAFAILRDSNTAQGKFIDQSLQDFLSIQDPSERHDRHRDFVAMLVQAFNVGSPLVQENIVLMKELHPGEGRQQPSRKICSPIPVERSDELYTKIESALTAIGAWHPDDSPGWFGHTKSSDIIIFQASPTSTSAMVLSSLMKPVMAQWMGLRDNPDARRDFWAMKRARPLVESIPVVPSVLDDMVEGWFVSAILGQRLTDSPETRLGWRSQIWDPTNAEWLEFPYPLLGTDGGDKEQLPGVLLSILIAMAQCDHQSSLAPLRPYRRLASLGRGLGGSQGDALAEWIRSGTVAPSAPQPPEALAGSSGDTPEARQERIRAAVTRSLEDYEAYFKRQEDQGDPHVTPLGWELRFPIRQAHERILGALNKVSQGDGGALA